MAPIAVKRRRLNPAHANSDRYGDQSLLKEHSTDLAKVPDGEIVRQDDEDSEEDRNDSFPGMNKPGMSYNLLLKTFQKSNGPRTNKKDRKNSQPKFENEFQERQSSSLPSNDEPVEDTGNADLVRNENLPDFEPTDEELRRQLEDDEDDSTDSFETHFANPSDTFLVDAIGAVKGNKWQNKDSHIPTVGKQTTVLPAGENDASANTTKISSVKDMKLKQKLVEPSTAILTNFSSVLEAISKPIADYQDLLYCGRTSQNSDDLRNLASLHAVNHVLKTRDRIIKNTARLTRGNKDDTIELRDQGFTRPKVLILLETRQACSRYMDSISAIFQPEQQENKKRFQDAFVEKDGGVSKDKPADFRELFEGNDDNEFRLGVKFTRKTIRYYSPFYTSDIILASPLGLRRAIKPDDPKKADSDFLSSIEMIIVDQTEAMLMQNWEHIEFVFEHLNLQPKEAHDCDFSRVRYWYLDKIAKYLRQTIVFSAYLTPELNGLFSSYMQNAAGKIKITPEHDGLIQNLGISVRQTFSRLRSRNPSSDPDDRFKYFANTIVPQLARAAGPSGEGLGALIFIPSYLDFVRIRNFFSTSTDVRNLTFGSISEYTDLPSSRRARSHFIAGRQSVMLYTGRAHHFRRYNIKGVKKVYLYGLPENPLFYNEIVGGFLASSIADGKLDPSEATAKVMFSRWDGLALERIVGKSRAGRMLKDTGGDTFDFR